MKRIGIILIILSACNKPLSYTEPLTEDITESVYASGVIKSRSQYQVYPLSSGILDEVRVHEGDLVNKGDILFTVSGDVSGLNRENALLASEFADYRNNARKLHDARINLELAAKKKSQDSLLFERQQKLWKQNIGSKLELEQRELSARSSAAAYESARLKLRDLDMQLKFNSKQSKKSLEISSRIHDENQIRSKISGRVFSILRKQGEMISPQTAVAIIGEADSFIAELQVDEYDISVIRTGMPVFLTLDSYRDSLYEARVSKIYPIMNEKSKTFTIEAVFTKRPSLLYPNLTLEASIVLRTRKQALTIPRTSLLNDSTVLMKDGSQRRVKTGLKDFKKIEITHGLAPGETIRIPEK